MKRLLLIGFAACTFALASILSASAMPIAHTNALAGDDSPIIQVHGWGHHHWGHHHGWGHRHWGHRR
jgi:Spy/CpxP family protein refolding chaperone